MSQLRQTYRKIASMAFPRRTIQSSSAHTRAEEKGTDRGPFFCEALRRLLIVSYPTVLGHIDIPVYTIVSDVVSDEAFESTLVGALNYNVHV